MAFAGYGADQMRLRRGRPKGSLGRRLIVGWFSTLSARAAAFMLVSFGVSTLFLASTLIGRAEEARSRSGPTPGSGSSIIAPSVEFCARPAPLVCAHGTVGSVGWDEKKRGTRPLPNTVPALALAVSAGHACVEVDVSRTKDGYLVALHSRELRRLTDGRVSNPGDVTLAEVMALEIPGGRGHRVATFAEAMAAVAGKGLTQITVDFKDGPPHGWAGFGEAVLAEVGLADPTGAGCPECVYWGKEDGIMLDVVRELPEAKVGYTIANFSAALRAAGVDKVTAGRGIVGSAYAAAVQSEMVDTGLTAEVRGAGVEKVFAWTVNEPARVRHVANQGVDGIVTDEPEECTRQVTALRAACGGAGKGWRFGQGGASVKASRKSLRG